MAQETLPRGMLERLMGSLKLEGINLHDDAELSILYLLEKLESNKLPMHETFALLVCCYAEAAKLDLSPADLQDQLRRANLTDGQCGAIVEVYQKSKAELRKTLLRIGWHPPHVLHADWKLSYHVKGHNQGLIGKPSYMISLKLQDCDTSQPRDLEFRCTTEELQDLVWKLKEATKAVQNLANQGQ